MIGYHSNLLGTTGLKGIGPIWGINSLSPFILSCDTNEGEDQLAFFKQKIIQTIFHTLTFAFITVYL